jgi:hypothetical protein
MTTLLIILACLFIGLALMVTLTEKFAKPMEAKDSQKMGKILIILVAILLLARAIEYALQ